MKLKNILGVSTLALLSNTVNAQISTVYMCKACPKGTYTDGKSESCTSCEFGTYNPYEAQSSCSPCEAGKYQDKEGQASCNDCPPGTWAPLKSKNCTNCLLTGVATCDSKTGKATNCIGGYGLTSDGYCQKCAAGYYSEGGTMACTACPIGTYSSSSGAASCSTCAATSYGEWSGECGSVKRSYTAYCTSTGSTSSTDKSSSGNETKDLGGCPGDLKCNYNHQCACEDHFVGNGGSIQRQGTSCVTVCPTPYTPCSTSCIISSCDHETSKTCKYKDDNGKTQKKTLSRTCTFVAPYGWTACSRRCDCDPWPSCP